MHWLAQSARHGSTAADVWQSPTPGFIKALADRSLAGTSA
eukprot:CAMPEP_0171268584 /NCGR_PEP_ID=MMETSP0790-20130122/59752_1 /TAXON_ID=2925 /ORGANISM="Alexandrium catenella, Strain OF101" /LENGTH=39 /DNA_ID= /DNA_START= /DNA_END= /DNA_ORIENTATION=